MSFRVSCFISLVHNRLRSPRNRGRPSDPAVTSDVATTSPRPRHIPCTCWRRKQTHRSQVPDFSSRHWICLWSEHQPGIAGQGLHRCLQDAQSWTATQPQPCFQRPWPRGISSEGSYGQRSNPSVILEKKDKENLPYWQADPLPTPTTPTSTNSLPHPRQCVFWSMLSL